MEAVGKLTSVRGRVSVRASVCDCVCARDDRGRCEGRETEKGREGEGEREGERRQRKFLPSALPDSLCTNNNADSTIRGL